jgi:hypothetical protein
MSTSPIYLSLAKVTITNICVNRMVRLEEDIDMYSRGDQTVEERCGRGVDPWVLFRSSQYNSSTHLSYVTITQNRKPTGGDENDNIRINSLCNYKSTALECFWIIKGVQYCSIQKGRRKANIINHMMYCVKQAL